MIRIVVTNVERKCDKKKKKNTALYIKMLPPDKWKSAKRKASVEMLIEWMLLNPLQYFAENTNHTLEDQLCCVLLSAMCC